MTIHPIVKRTVTASASLIKKPAVLFALLLIGTLGISSYLYYQNNNLNQQILQLQSVQGAATDKNTEDNQKLINQVASLIELPTGETPTIATVTDKDKLKDQPFFANSENGDRVLVFTNAKKAILYRPATNKVIDVAPITIGSDAKTSPAPTRRPTATPKPETTPSPTP